MRTNDLVGAIEVLQRGRAQAREWGERRKAGEFSGWIAALRIALNDDEGALADFTTAEEDDPDNLFHKLTTASQLFALRADVDATLLKLEEIDLNRLGNASSVHAFHDLLGRALLRAGRTAEALAAFDAMADDDAIRGIRAESMALGLVTDLVKADLVPTACKRYLGIVAAKTRERNLRDVDARVAILEEILRKRAS